MQRAILDRLHTRPGGDEFGRYRNDWFLWRAWLPEGMHDLRVVLVEMAHDDGRMIAGRYVESALSASFSRAAAGLGKRGLIRFVGGLVPVSRVEDGSGEAPIHRLADGLYLFAPHSRRFTGTLDDV